MAADRLMPAPAGDAQRFGTLLFDREGTLVSALDCLAVLG